MGEMADGLWCQFFSNFENFGKNTIINFENFGKNGKKNFEEKNIVVFLHQNLTNNGS